MAPRLPVTNFNSRYARPLFTAPRKFVGRDIACNYLSWSHNIIAYDLSVSPLDFFPVLVIS